jgi:hypothetical protein
MSKELRDLFKKDLDRIPLRPAETWVPAGAQPRLRGPRWRAPLAIAATVALVVLAIVGGRELAALRDRMSTTATGVIAGKAIYLSPSFNGSGWMQIDPETLTDVSSKPLLDIAPSPTNSSATQVSEDGSTIIVSDYSPGVGAVKRIYDGRTGRLRGYFVPETEMALGFLSADGQLGMGLPFDGRGPQTGAKIIVSIADGRVIRRVPDAGAIGVIQAMPVAPDLSAIYYVTTPEELSLISPIPEAQPYSLVAQSTVTGVVSPPIPLPGITAGTVYAGPVSATTTLAIRPGIAFLADGSRIAAMSVDGRTLVVVDTRTREVTSVAVHKKTSLFDPFGGLVAEAKTVNDQESRSMLFTADGTAVITWVTETHYDENGATRTTHGLQRIDVGTGLITAETLDPAGIYSVRLSPDGSGLYLVLRTQEPPTPVYVLRRLDLQTLGVKTERALPDYAELEILAAPAPAATIATPTPPARTQPTTTVCTHDRLVYLVEQFFSRYNGRNPLELATLFNTSVPADGGGFGNYVDNPGVQTSITDPRKLVPYWLGRFAANDRFDAHTATYAPPGPNFDAGNPTVAFTRSFTGGTQQGNMKLVCGGGFIRTLIMSSDYAVWGSRDAFGLWFSVPTDWKGPEDIQTVKDNGAPLHWLVFTDAAGQTQVTLWLWNGASVDEVFRNTLAATFPPTTGLKTTVSDAGLSRPVLEIRASTSWSGRGGGGIYENRHLLVQVTPTLVADVIVHAPLVNGASKVSDDQIKIQDRIAVRLAPVN